MKPYQQILNDEHDSTVKGKKVIIYDTAGKPLVYIDQDTGAGSLYSMPVTWRKSAAGGPEFGTSADPVRTDPTGTTTQPVQLTGSTVTDITLQNAAVATGNGTALTVSGNKTLTISINGTSTSRTIVFEVSDADDNFTSISGVKVDTLSSASQTTGTAEKWQFDITGFKQFRARISAIAGGNITVKGKAVA